MEDKSDPEPGIYSHYRGGAYEVLFIAPHTETLEELVIYRSVQSTPGEQQKYWARPRAMFLDEVEYQGKIVPRFERQSVGG